MGTTSHPGSQEPDDADGQPKGISAEDLASVRAMERRVEKARIAGETGAWSVYRVVFDDGCDYFGYTNNVIAWKVDELCDPAHRSAVPRLVLHHREMEMTIECLASGLDRGDAQRVRNRMLERTQDESSRRRDEETAPELCQIDMYLSENGPVARYYARKDGQNRGTGCSTTP